MELSTNMSKFEMVVRELTGRKERKKNMPLVELIQYYERFKQGRGVILHNGRGCSNLVWRWGVFCASLETPTISKGHFDRKRYPIT